MPSNDLVAVLPGITGSTLKKNGAPIWEPSAGAVLQAIRTFCGSIRQLRLPEGIGDDHPEDGVTPDRLIPDIHVIPGLWSPIRGYTRLLKRLESIRVQGRVGNVIPVPYDWRLSNRYNGQRLSQIIEDQLGQWRDSHPSRADAQVVFICHSMGGLVARWYIEKCGGAEVTRKLITLGTPYRGAARAVSDLANGVRRGLGPVALDLTDFARSLPSSHQLLPDYACVDRNGALDHLDAANVPNIESSMMKDGLRFHRDLAAAEAARPASLDNTHAIVGTQQPTPTTIRILPNGVQLLQEIGAENDFGDGTVPLAGALGHGLWLDTNRVWRIVANHGHLQANRHVLDEIESVITSTPIRRRGDNMTPIRVTAPELVLLGEPISVAVEIEPDAKQRVPGVEIELIADRPTGGAQPDRRLPVIRDGRAEATFSPREPGVYSIRVHGAAPGSPVTPITATVLVWAGDRP